MDKGFPDSSAIDGSLAIIAALVVLFAAMLDARISAILSVILLLAFAGYKMVLSRQQRSRQKVE